MSFANDSRFSSTSNYFVATASAVGGTTLDSTVLIQPSGITGRINTNLPSAVSGSILELGPSTTNYKTVTIYDNGLVGGAGLNIASGEPATSALNIVGPAPGGDNALIRVNTTTGGEQLTLAANSTRDNIVLAPTLSTFNTNIQLGVSGVANFAFDINGYNLVTGPVVSCADNATTIYANPAGVAPGLHSIVTDNGTSDIALGTTGVLNIAGQWSAGCGCSAMGLPGAGGGAPSTMLCLSVNGAGQLIILNQTGEGARDIQLSFIRLSGVGFNVPV